MARRVKPHMNGWLAWYKVPGLLASGTGPASVLRAGLEPAKRPGQEMRSYRTPGKWAAALSFMNRRVLFRSLLVTRLIFSFRFRSFGLFFDETTMQIASLPKFLLRRDRRRFARV